jgi:hypothetical protein
VRILGHATDLARQAQLSATLALTAHQTEAARAGE